MPARARRLLVTALCALALLLGGVAAAAPSVAAPSADSPLAATDTLDPSLVRTLPAGGGVVRPLATIEGEEQFCKWLTGVYVNHPTYYTVRVYNCRQTDVFVKGVYLNGTFSTCVRVPARSSRHLGGSVIKPIDDAQVC